ncbi:MAG: AtpZ/AtpI family protein [Bdellovibrionales bacterium]|nr:AtpZ/AtpI family protein [Bdellovibrionales bacterium]
MGLSLCTEIAVAGLIGWWVGAWIDTKLGTKPWGTTVGIMGFVSISFVHIVRVLSRLADRLEKEDS